MRMAITEMVSTGADMRTPSVGCGRAGPTDRGHRDTAVPLRFPPAGAPNPVVSGQAPARSRVTPATS